MQFQATHERLQVGQFGVVDPQEHATLGRYVELPATRPQQLLRLCLLPDQALLQVLHVPGIGAVGQDGVDEAFAKRRHRHAGQQLQARQRLHQLCRAGDVAHA